MRVGLDRALCAAGVARPAGSVGWVLIGARRGLQLGVPAEQAAILVPTPAPPAGTAFPPRRLVRQGVAVFELNLWCGTCPALFHKLTDPQAADLGVVSDLLSTGLSGVDDRVLGAYGHVLPVSTYTALLLEIAPRLVRPGGAADYFCHEQVVTWGVDPVVGSPEDPGTAYYRTFETPMGPSRHLYEFVVPMVPPTWNDRGRVEQYVATASGRTATAVSYSLLDVLQPATDEGADYYEHWVLTHFLLDGHHKVEAAAAAGEPLRLLSLIDEQSSIASVDDVGAMVRARSQRPAVREPANGR